MSMIEQTLIIGAIAASAMYLFTLVSWAFGNDPKNVEKILSVILLQFLFTTMSFIAMTLLSMIADIAVTAIGIDGQKLADNIERFGTRNSLGIKCIITILLSLIPVWFVNWVYMPEEKALRFFHSNGT